MRNVLKASLLATAMTWAFAAPTSAATLTITDTFGGSNTIWTLNAQTGCTTCTISLTANFQDPAGPAVNAYTGTYLDSVQWKIDGTDPVTAGFTTTTAGTAANWSFAVDASLNANQCSGGASDAICGQWIGGGTAGGFGPIVNGSTLTWNFSSTFAAALPATLTSGNIRAAFNNSDGSNFNIFSPDGGTFTTTSTTSTTGVVTTTTTGVVTTTTTGITPEPTLLTLLGSGLLMAGRRLRRRTA